MTGRVEEEAEGPEVSYQLSVNEELIEEIKLCVEQHLCSWYEESEGEIEPVSHPAQSLQHWLSRRAGELSAFSWSSSHLRAVVRLKY